MTPPETRQVAPPGIPVVFSFFANHFQDEINVERLHVSNAIIMQISLDQYVNDFSALLPNCYA